MVVKPASQGSALGVKFAHSSDSCRARSWGRSPTIARSCWSATSRGATSRCRCSTGRRSHPRGEPIALPVVEAIPREEDFYDYESRYEIGMTTFVCPAELPAETTARAQELALAVYELLGCHGVARVDLMLEESSGELTVLGDQRRSPASPKPACCLRPRTPRESTSTRSSAASSPAPSPVSARAAARLRYTLRYPSNPPPLARVALCRGARGPAPTAVAANVPAWTIPKH